MKDQICCVDTSYLIAIYDRSDNVHEQASASYRNLFGSAGRRMLLVWPIIYETLATRMVRRPDRITQIEADWRRLRRTGQPDFIDDRPFRERALEELFL